MPPPTISRFTLWFFRGIARGYFHRHFRAVRISGASHFTKTSGPLIIYGNHSSWWDPMVSVRLAHKLMADRRHYAPMDAISLERYGILKHIGVFGIDLDSVRGAARFLRTGLDVLTSGGVLWVTPQGRFADVRERPLVFKPGLATLAGRVPGGCTVLPLAIEYVFWNERMPEALLQFGEPIYVHEEPGPVIEERLKASLLETMETLKLKSIARDTSAFEILQRGRSGTGGFYSIGQRLKALLQHRPYQPEHTPSPLVEQDERG